MLMPGRLRADAASSARPFTTPPTRNKNDPMLTFYRDTFAITCREGPADLRHEESLHGTRSAARIPDDQRIAGEGACSASRA